MSAKTSLVKDNSKIFLLLGLLVGIILPLFIFIKPVIIYENMDAGYGVRYYIFGLTNFTSATIPETHKNKNVISLRGNTFSNMPFLKEVNLPDTITEIRGQAFKNCRNLSKVNIPKNLEYLGGGAFYNAKKIEKIELPDSLTYLGGEAFYNAKRLKDIKISNSLTEIRGDTFEYCTSLEKIEIPDNITRIGGHAFYGDYNLKEVIISENSKLNEIGSSAFRRCNNLYEITIPYEVNVNERAFKESPTNIKYFQKDITEIINKYSKNTTHTFNGSGEFIIEDGENTITVELEYIMSYSKIASFRVKSNNNLFYKFGSVDMGSNSDLSRAFRIVDRFVDNHCSYGFDKFVLDKMSSNDLLNRKESQIYFEMEKYYAQAKKIIFDNIVFLDKLAKELMKKQTLIISDIKRIREECRV